MRVRIPPVYFHSGGSGAVEGMGYKVSTTGSAGPECLRVGFKSPHLVMVLPFAPEAKRTISWRKNRRRMRHVSLKSGEWVVVYHSCRKNYRARCESLPRCNCGLSLRRSSGAFPQVLMPTHQPALESVERRVPFLISERSIIMTLANFFTPDYFILTLLYLFLE